MKIKIPVYEPLLIGSVKKYVNDCINTSWISSRGKYINAFEEKFGSYIGVKNSVAVSNGTVALHLALLALDIKEGDEVIVPTLTYIATVNPVKFVGATPVFVDARRDTWQIDYEKIEQRISSKTKAIIITHLYGHPCEMDQIMHICKKYNLYLIEDCAEALGSKYKGVHVGTFGDISTFSFYGNKTITTGEGGMVVTNNDKLKDKIFLYKMQGVSSTKRYWHEVIGYNYKMTNICAAIGLAQLEKVKMILDMKKNVAKWYSDSFDQLGIDYHKSQKSVFNSYWMFSVLTGSNKQRNSLQDYLLKRYGIETRPTFYPVHTMPMYYKKNNSFPISEDIGLRGVNLPSSANLSKKKVEYISRIIGTFIKGKKTY